MVNPMFIYSVVLVNIIAVSIDATESDINRNFMKARDSVGKSFPDGLGVVSPGQSITIECQHKGSMVWSRRDAITGVSSKLQSNDRITIDENKLLLKNISFLDAAAYYCEENGAAYTFHLNVYAITDNTSATVPTVETFFEMNDIKFSQKKIDEKKSANVSCTCDTGSSSASVAIIWEGKSYIKFSDLYSTNTTKEGSKHTSVLTLQKLQNKKNLYGKYTCSCNAVAGTLKQADVFMNVLPVFEDHKTSMRTTEGSNLTLVCEAWGYPEITIPVQWKFENNATLREGMRVNTDSATPGRSELIIDIVTQKHRGVYTCHAQNSIGENIAGTMVRVKGRYAALWPFIGIVIQVIILAIIIIIYECNKSHKPQESNNFNSNEQEPGVAIRSGGDQKDIRQRLMVH